MQANGVSGPENEREWCDSLRHRIKRLKQYAAQIEQLLLHPSNLFTWDSHTARVVPRKAGDDSAWLCVGNLTLRLRVFEGSFPWYEQLLPFLEEDDVRTAPSPCITAHPVPAPESPVSISVSDSAFAVTAPTTSYKRRASSHLSVGSESLGGFPIPPLVKHHHDLMAHPTKRARTSTDSTNATVHHRAVSTEHHAPVASDKGSDVSTAPAPKLAPHVKRAWSNEQDLVLIKCYMQHWCSGPRPPSGRHISSVWRHIVLTVFGSELEPNQEREAGDSARHRVKKLRAYAAQVHKLLATKQRLFYWDSKRSRLRVNIHAGHDVEGTWNLIRNPQVRNRLMRSEYPWLPLLKITDSDLPSTFHSTTLGPEFYDAKSTPLHLSTLAQVDRSPPPGAAVRELRTPPTYVPEPIHHHPYREYASYPPHYDSYGSYYSPEQPYPARAPYYIPDPPSYSTDRRSTRGQWATSTPLPSLQSSTIRWTTDPSQHTALARTESCTGLPSSYVRSEYGYDLGPSRAFTQETRTLPPLRSLTSDATPTSHVKPTLRSPIQDVSSARWYLDVPRHWSQAAPSMHASTR